MFAHKSRVSAFHCWDVRENVAPQVIVVALVNNEAGSVQAELAASVNRSAGRLAENHGHCPLHEDDILAAGDGCDVHLKFLAALGQAIAHGHKIGFADHLLDGVLENDFFSVVGKNMRPIRFAVGVIGLRPEL